MNKLPPHGPASPASTLPGVETQIGAPAPAVQAPTLRPHSLARWARAVQPPPQAVPVRSSPPLHPQPRPLQLANAATEPPATADAPQALARVAMRDLRDLHAPRQAAPSLRRGPPQGDEANAAGSAAPVAPVAAGFTAAKPAGDADTPVPHRAAQVQALIEACCGQVWVSDGGRAATPGVLLDLGRWMPGCSLEVARAGGQLRIHLRGVRPERCAELQAELGAWSEGLAQRLGCSVLSTVTPKPRSAAEEIAHGN